MTEGQLSKSLNTENTLAYFLANQLTLEKTKKLRDEQLRYESQKALFDATEAANLVQKEKKHNELIQQVAEAQKAQMQVYEQRKAQLQAEKLKPAINPQFSGYPSIPQTPLGLKRSRKLEQQAKLKAELEMQVQEKTAKKEKVKAEEQKQATFMIEQLEAQRKAREEEENRKKEVEKAELWRAWKEAERVKKEQMNILHGVPLDLPPLETVPSPTLSRSPVLGIAQGATTYLPPEPLDQPHLSHRERGQLRRINIAERLKLQEDQRARHSLELQRNRQMRRILAGKQVASHSRLL